MVSSRATCNVYILERSSSWDLVLTLKRSVVTSVSISVRKRKQKDWLPVNCLPAPRERAAVPLLPRKRNSGLGLNRWMASFDVDRSRFHSLAVMCEQRLRKVSRKPSVHVRGYTILECRFLNSIVAVSRRRVVRLMRDRDAVCLLGQTKSG